MMMMSCLFKRWDLLERWAVAGEGVWDSGSGWDRFPQLTIRQNKSVFIGLLCFFHRRIINWLQLQ